MLRHLGIIVFLLGATILAEPTTDTLISADGTAGPFRVGTHFVNPTTLSVAPSDSTAALLPAWRYIDSTNSILFDATIDSGTIFRVRFEQAFYGLPKTYSLFAKSVIDTSDTNRAVSTVLIVPARPSYDAQNLDVSGSKTVGVALGNNGQMNMEQALDVRISGAIGPQTELSANLSDQGTSLDGATRELGEIDMVYLTLTNPRFKTTVGDQYIAIPDGGILAGQKKIKGISLGYRNNYVSTNAFGSISGGKYAVQTLRGRLGLQGPYTLTGQGEADLINPVAGTIRVTVNGRSLNEGEEADFTVDYDLGTLTFSPRCPINDEQIIRLEYEYKSFDYQRLTFGTDVSAAAPDSIVSIRGMLWCDLDNKEYPIEMSLDGATRTELEAAGDRAVLQPNGRRVHPNDIDRRNALYPLYRLDTIADGRRIYRYEPTPADSAEVYLVWFKKAPAGGGDYTRDSTRKQERFVYFYTYVGPGNGVYDCLTPFPAPGRTTIGQMEGILKPRPWLTISSEAAGEERDRNLFSKKDDDDNTASATRSNILLGHKNLADRSAWFGGRHTRVSSRFSREVLSAYERKTLWDREGDTAGTGERTLWEAYSGATISEGNWAELLYGQYIRGTAIGTHRGTALAHWKLTDRLNIDYSGAAFHHPNASENRAMQSNRLSLQADLDKTAYSVDLSDEWRFGGSGPGRGQAGGGLRFGFKPINLTEALSYTRHLKGDRFVFSADTTGLISWDQGIKCSPVGGWNLGGSSSWQRRTRPQDTLSTLLVTLTNDVLSPRSGLTTHAEYTVTSEKASSFVQVPVFAGEGLGAYSFDSTTSEYVPDTKRGSFFLDEREVYDTLHGGTVQKSRCTGNWSWKPPVRKGGFLADITVSALFAFEEYLSSDRELSPTSWLPGFHFLSGRDDSLVTFANISYRQSLDWRPDNLWGLHGALFVKPARQKIRRFEERSWEWGGGADRAWGRWFAGADGRMLFFRRQDMHSTLRDTIEDRFINLTQRFDAGHEISVSMEETVGGAHKREGSSSSANQPRAGNRYFLLHPGCSFRPKNKGFAEVSYTFSSIDIPGSLDYRMARGYAGGISHTIQALADINAGASVTLSGQYRGEFNRPWGERTFRRPLHTLSLEVRIALE
jgi:hypothetical protein